MIKHPRVAAGDKLTHNQNAAITRLVTRSPFSKEAEYQTRPRPGPELPKRRKRTLAERYLMRSLERATATIYHGVPEDPPQRLPITAQRFQAPRLEPKGPPPQVFKIIALIRDKTRCVYTPGAKYARLGRARFAARHYILARAFLKKRVELKVGRLVKLHGWTEEQAKYFLATELYPK